MNPSRQTAIGRPCAKHPELQGLRYFPNRLCVECAKAKSKAVYGARELTVSQEITVLRGEVARLKSENEAQPTWQPMESCPKHVDVLFFHERNGVIPGRLTDADSFMTDKERDEWDGGEEAQLCIDAFGFGHWGVDRMDGSETPSHWMPYPEEPVVASVLGETVSVPKELLS